MAWRKAKTVVCTGQERDMQWHLMWCRRRQENAAVLVMKLLDSDAKTLNALVAGFRVTDSVVATRRASGFEIRAVLDEQGLSRTSLEQRFVQMFGTTALQFGWARFPEEGLTLEVLVDSARASIPQPDAATTKVRGRSLDLRDPRLPSGAQLEAVDA